MEGTAEPRELKLLLLGGSCVGKTTLFKKLKHNESFYNSSIIQSLLTSPLRSIIQEANLPNFDTLLEEHTWTPEQLLETFHHPLLQKALQSPSIFNSSCIYPPFYTQEWLSQLRSPALPNPVPLSKEEYLRLRVKTTGIIETHWEEGGTSYKLCDVGGAKSERRKWIHCFDNVHQTIFVADLCSAIWPHPEDSDSLETWKALHGVKFLKNFTLVFNKWDIYEKFMKLDQFKEFKSKFGVDLCNVVSCARFIANQYIQCVKDEKIKVIFGSITSEENFESFREFLLDPNRFEEKEKVRMVFPPSVPTWEKEIRLLYLGHEDKESPLSRLPLEIIKSIHQHLF